MGGCDTIHMCNSNSFATSAALASANAADVAKLLLLLLCDLTIPR